jgi:hypothetical protein
MNAQLISEVQKALKIDDDGVAGPITWKAIYKKIVGKDWKESSKHVKASSFADPADIVAFKRCKATGKTDLQCFAVGDNGIGLYGANTAQDHTPMCALHRDDMVRLFGSVKNAAHKKILVHANGKEVVCSVEDRMSSVNRIDLNPAAAKYLGLKPPFLVDASFRVA